jgi:hypothetical protein
MQLSLLEIILGHFTLICAMDNFHSYKCSIILFKVVVFGIKGHCVIGQHGSRVSLAKKRLY